MLNLKNKTQLAGMKATGSESGVVIWKWYIWNWYITAEDVATSAGINLLVLWPVLSPEVGALHPQETENKAQHAHGQSCHEEASHYLDVA